MKGTTKDINLLAKKIWEYHLLHHKLKIADLILVMGSTDIQVAERGADVYLEGWAPLIVISGGLGRIAKKIWRKPEAEVFAEVVINKGVPKNKIIIENKSTNTGENVVFTKNLLKKRKITPRRIIVVHKPFMERRTYSIVKKLWAKVDIIVTSPQVPFELYKIPRRTHNDLINAIVGNLQRIKEYPNYGFQIPQIIPKSVWIAYKELVELGYTKKLI